MHNYKALKAAGKVSVQKVEVVDQVKVDEVKDKDGKITTMAQKKRSHEELQVVCKCYDAQTGEAKDDSVRAYSLSEVKREIDRCKSDVKEIEDKQSNWEELEKDLKAL
tara:strand:+ start:3642 stop:3965 length:324 start_codon:yes stop_codon:yes gene_type:complete